MATDTAIKLMVGLGNPGPTYRSTRHNAGAWFIERLAQQQEQTLTDNTKLHGRTGKIVVNGQTCYLLIPNTYMNLSGSAVAAIADYYQISSDAILIAHDEIDLDPGIVKLKYDGGHGGHNGLRDIFERLQTRAFYRLRIGVGKAKTQKAVADYVLSAPSVDEQIVIDAAITRALQQVPDLLAGKIEHVMKQLHTV